MDKITFTLKGHNCLIVIDSGLFSNLVSFLPLIHGDSVMLVTNNRLAPIYLNILYTQLHIAGIRVDKIVLPDGEQNKSLTILNQIFSALLARCHGRDTTIIALGGGVIGDLAGFAAASYQRGVRFIQIPTTLLSQVDSSIGGKTAINHPLGKNMIGAFYQPTSIIINLNFLNTLPRREISSGLAEVIKYGIIFDSIFFKWLENNLESLLILDPQALFYCIRRCCELKVKIVATDELEQGERILLNFGHTYGHAIETYMGYGKFLHGEAIAIGMMMAAHTARRLNKFSDIEIERIRMLLLRAGLPVTGPSEMVPQKYLSYMMRDKKAIAGRLRLVLPVMLGRAEVYTEIANSTIIESIKDCYY